MNKKKITTLLILLFLLILTACQITPPDKTSNQPATAEIIPTELPATAIPTAERDIADLAGFTAENRILSPQGGYELTVPPLYGFDFYGPEIQIYGPAFNLNIGGFPPEEGSLQEQIDQLQQFFIEQSPTIQFEQPYTLEVGAEEALTVDFTDVQQGTPIAGNFLVTDQLIIFTIITPDQIDSDQDWKETWTELLASITLKPIDDQSTCAVSADESYGLTQENPIYVGGGVFAGPARVRAYITNLLLNEAPIEAERMGNAGMATDGTGPVDAYTIRNESGEVTLYFNQYEFRALSAPHGFSCIGLIPLLPPTNQQEK